MATHIVDPIGSRIDELERRMSRLQSASSFSTGARWFFTLALLGVLGAAGYFLYTQYQRVTNKKFIAELSNQATKKFEELSPEAREQINKAVNRVSPIVMKNFQDQLAKDSPKIMAALEKERDPFFASMQKEFEKKLNDRADLVLADVEKLLKDELKIEDPKELEMLKANFKVAIVKLAEEHYSKPLEGELMKLNKSWDSFPLAPPPKSGDPSHEDQIKALLYDILLDSVRLQSELQTAAPAK
jgi:hypothetical protein